MSKAGRPPHTANAITANHAAGIWRSSRHPRIASRHRPLALVAFVGGKAEAQKRFGGAAGAAILLALLTHVAAGFRVAVRENPRPPRLVVDIALAGGGGGSGGALALLVEQGGAEGQVAVAGGGGEEGFSGGPCGSRHRSLCLAITARVISSRL